MTVPLDWNLKVLVFISISKMLLTLSVFPDTKYPGITANLVYGRSRSVSPRSLPDCRILSPVNLSYRWKMSLVFLAFRPVLTSRQLFPGS